MLFDELKERTCTDRTLIKKTNYEFLDQSSLDEHAQIRKLLNLCFLNINQSSKNEIKSRVQSSLESVFHAVCFELIVGHLFKTLGCSLEEHPEILGTEKHPDFLVTLQSGEQFYLELVTIDEYDDSSIEEFETFIKKLRNEKYFTHIREMSGRKINHNDNIKLRKLISGWWHKNNTSIVSPVTFENESKDFKVELEISPIGAFAISSSISSVRFHSQLLEKLKKKANRYGELNLPYIIATTFRPSRHSVVLQFMQRLIVDTLYGGSKIYNLEKSKLEPIRSLWNVDCEEVTYSNVSAVLFFDELTVMRALKPFKYCLFLNHFSKKPVYDGLTDFFAMFYTDGINEYSRDGYNLSEILKGTLA
ncbi:hypothetical protein [Salmonella enterica]|uniref:hypothetical protein n=1 Tax=Salmonella enterica TaxID=28901 RepID=UPI000DECF04A|nr:hypothetical protein [Salmonella enterica]AXD11563.1 hypothetical protein CHE29_23440 [Salmonella enterica]